MAKQPQSISKKQPNPIDRHVGARVRMRRMMLGMSQEKLGKAIGLTFQQVQKYEKGTNRIGSSRLVQIGSILQVQVEFFFDGAPRPPGYPGIGKTAALPPQPAYISDFLSSTDGLNMTKAFTSVKSPKLRRSIADLVEIIASEQA